mgnify:CR=1 FL=1
MILHGYFRSGSAFRTRIALNLKNLTAEQQAIHLRRGEQHSESYRRLNPQGLVPALELADDVLTQSLAIIEYFDELHPDPPLLPSDAIGRARVRSLSLIIACDTHPLGNLRVLSYLHDELELSDDACANWYNHWIGLGLAAVEARLGERESGNFCHADAPGLADICLVPQVINAQRFGLDISRFTRINQVTANALQLDAFRNALPDRQPDCEP